MTAHRLSMWMVAACCAAVCGVIFVGSASADTLSDGRTYEQVTPEEKQGSEAYIPPRYGGEGAYNNAHEFTLGVETRLTFQAAADGSRIAYLAGPSVGGVENQGINGGNQYLATRSATGGWSSELLSRENAPSAIFQAFSPNLSTAFVDSLNPLSSSAPGFGEEEVSGRNYDALYSLKIAGDEYVPFFSVKPPYRSIAQFGTVYETSNRPEFGAHQDRENEFLAFEGASSDYTHLLFAANDALTQASEGRPAAEGGAGSQFENENNLYESVNGQLRLVNVLPDGTTHANATFGGLEPLGAGEPRPQFGRAISADGSRIFWTDRSTGHIYMRENGATTTEISPEGTYQTATTDGSTVFYTNKDLYAYETESGHTTDLTPGVPVERVVGASGNGEYIYYITAAKELMLLHNDVATSIAEALYPKEINSEVTPDGRSIVFTLRGVETSFFKYQVQVYVYNAESNAVYCASCTSHETVTLNGFGSTLPMTNAENVYQPRWITTDGDRVFFISVNRLVPQDTNELDDVYEWVRPGADGCAESNGCVHLLSSGTSTDNSLFLDASENGEDVFIVTRSSLVGSDEDGLFDIYDARLGAPPVTASPACSGTGCQGVPSVAPIFATPSSVTFEGVGNFVSPAKAKPKVAKKPKPQHKKKRKTKGKKHKGKGSRTSKGVRKARAGAKGGRS